MGTGEEEDEDEAGFDGPVRPGVLRQLGEGPIGADEEKLPPA